MNWEMGFNINVKRRTPINKDILIKTRKRSEFTWKLMYPQKLDSSEKDIRFI